MARCVVSAVASQVVTWRAKGTRSQSHRNHSCSTSCFIQCSNPCLVRFYLPVQTSNTPCWPFLKILLAPLNGNELNTNTSISPKDDLETWRYEFFFAHGTEVTCVWGKAWFYGFAIVCHFGHYNWGLHPLTVLWKRSLGTKAVPFWLVWCVPSQIVKWIRQLVKSQRHNDSLLPSCQAATWPLQLPRNLAKQDTFVNRWGHCITEENTIYGRLHLFGEWSCSLVRSESENLTLHAQKPWGHLPNNLGVQEAKINTVICRKRDTASAVVVNWRHWSVRTLVPAKPFWILQTVHCTHHNSHHFTKQDWTGLAGVCLYPVGKCKKETCFHSRRAKSTRCAFYHPIQIQRHTKVRLVQPRRKNWINRGMKSICKNIFSFKLTIPT